MTKREFLSEFGLHMFATGKLLAQQDDLEREQALQYLEGNPCHIYLVCRRPRITLDQNTFAINADHIRGRLYRQLKNQCIPFDFELRNLLGRDDLVLDCPYPNSAFRLLAPDGNVVSSGKVGVLAHMIPAFHEYLDLEVLYVGQAYGSDGSRTAPDRLCSHSTLQGIYANALTNSPDQEIWLVLCHFEELLLASFDGQQGEYGTNNDEDSQHIQKVLHTPVSEHQRICFTEAGLIRYFRPEYNITYKDSFPSPAHSTYATCYDIDYNSVSVEITTDDVGARLWSATISPTWYHFPRFPLHSTAERQDMFALVG